MSKSSKIDVTNTAEKFVNLVAKYFCWEHRHPDKIWKRLGFTTLTKPKIRKIREDEVHIFFEIVTAAGFEFTAVVKGEVLGNYCDQDGNSIGTYIVNNLCPFKVVGGRYEITSDNHFATGWLNCAVRRVVRGAERKDDLLAESREQLVAAIVMEIKRSVPLEPIRLTSGNDFMLELSPDQQMFGLEYFVDHVRDDTEIRDGFIGIHRGCPEGHNGFINRTLTLTAFGPHVVFSCMICALRVQIPRKEAMTYGDLRHALPQIAS